MNESEFLAWADRILAAVAKQADQWYDELDVDVEAERNGGVLTLVFDSGVRVVVNSQAPMQEMWVAAPSGGFHYRLVDGVWRDTRGGPDLAEALSQICSAAAGRELRVTL
ncbi:iron donor protein CyaY [Verticiella sediminum]|uniref:Iron-sulfur cluster assembly protein CyaY n=1 Tax=Verticiella sediminum TaxID=1247510 RepID=A0A556A8C8_9BURK|nr:iron donor protein CyaY [Verticiella sediminum]TSH89125.1 iron donor protein CyaY [Verticiella sediminum]